MLAPNQILEFYSVNVARNEFRKCFIQVICVRVCVLVRAF